MTLRERRAALYALVTVLIMVALTGCACVLVGALSGSWASFMLGVVLLGGPMLTLDDLRTRRHDVEVRR